MYRRLNFVLRTKSVARARSSQSREKQQIPTGYVSAELESARTMQTTHYLGIFSPFRLLATFTAFIIPEYTGCPCSCSLLRAVATE